MTKTLSTITYQIEATALDPIFHGAGSSGNTSLLRTQEVVLPDGSAASVPFVSGNSLRHGLRAALAQHLLTTLDVEERSLPKQAVDLLFSGGALTATGKNINLEQLRDYTNLIPMLSLLGYSAASTIVQGKLRVQNLHLVCAENAWRLPEWISDSPQASKRSGYFRSEEFGTRHDAKRATTSGSYIEWLDGDAEKTTQMIYDAQVIKAGSLLWTSVSGEGLTELEADALDTALALLAIDHSEDGIVINVGAKRSLGFGRIALSFGDAPVPTVHSSYEAHLLENRDEIIEAIKAVV